MIYIVVISAAVLIFHNINTPEQISSADRPVVFIDYLAFNADLIMAGEVWRLITWLFLPIGDGFIFPVLSLIFYYFIGTSLEREWGTPKFTIFYTSGFIFNLIFGFAMRYIFKIDTPLTPSYLNLSMFFTFAVYYPDFTIMLLFIIPVKIKWLALLNAAFFLLSIVFGIIFGQLLVALLPIVAILNFLVICGAELRVLLRPLRARTSPKMISYKNAAKKAKRSQESTPYRHKCTVCGKTDVSNPDMQFRYCSRCEGYHCYCLDHINSHIHFH